MREQIAQRRHQHQCINERVHAVERPASPRGPESPDLISCEWCRLGGLYFRTALASGHIARTISTSVAGGRKTGRGGRLSFGATVPAAPWIKKKAIPAWPASA